MGMDIETVKFVLENYRGPRALTLGRQNVFAATREVDALLGEPSGLAPYSRSQFADKLWQALGLQVDTLDLQDATIKHDLNVPWSAGPYNTVMDFGTLEHVFNFPVALRSCMDAIAPGGVFLSVTPCNNYAGHGFYQFGPEVFFRGMPGFSVEIRTLEQGPWPKWRYVPDPALAGTRVAVRSRWPTVMFVRAFKMGADWIPPQQSDYAAQWEGSAAEGQTGGPDRHPALKTAFKEYFPRITRIIEAFTRST